MESYKVTDKEINAELKRAKQAISSANWRRYKITGWTLRVLPEYIQLQIAYIDCDGKEQVYNVAL